MPDQTAVFIVDPHSIFMLGMATCLESLSLVGRVAGVDTLRTRDGAAIGRAAGKSEITNPEWRERIDDAVRAIDEARHLLRRALGLDEMFIQRGQAFHYSSFDEFDESLRSNRQLGEHINGLRQQALDNLNAIRDEIGLEPLKRIGTY